MPQMRQLFTLALVCLFWAPAMQAQNLSWDYAWRAPGPIEKLSFSPDGKRVAAVSNGQLYIWDAVGGAEPKLIDVPFEVKNWQWIMEGARLMVGDGVNAWGEVSLSTGSYTKNLKYTGKLIASAIFAGQNAIIRLDNGEIYGWDANGSKVKINGFQQNMLMYGGTIEDLPMGPMSMRPDEKVAAVAVGSNVLLFDPMTAKYTGMLSPAKSNIVAMAWSPGGDTLAIKGTGGVIEMWRVSDQTLLSAMHTTRGTAKKSDSSSLAFSPDGKFLISGTSSTSAVVWDVVRSKVVRDIEQSHGNIMQMQWSPNAQWLITASTDSTIRFGRVVDMNDTATETIIIAPSPKLLKKIGVTVVEQNSSKALQSTFVTLYLWDFDEEDGDVVSVYLNGEVILDHYTLTFDKFSVPIKFQPLTDNQLVVVAESAGTVGPMTAGIMLDDGVSTQQVVLTSSLEVSQAVKLQIR